MRGQRATIHLVFDAARNAPAPATVGASPNACSTHANGTDEDGEVLFHLGAPRWKMSMCEGAAFVRMVAATLSARNTGVRTPINPDARMPIPAVG